MSTFFQALPTLPPEEPEKMVRVLDLKQAYSPAIPNASSWAHNFHARVGDAVIGA
jgi:hypothetical protein